MFLLITIARVIVSEAGGKSVSGRVCESRSKNSHSAIISQLMRDNTPYLLVPCDHCLLLLDRSLCVIKSISVRTSRASQDPGVTIDVSTLNICSELHRQHSILYMDVCSTYFCRV